MISIMELERKQQHSHSHALLRECLRPLGIAYEGDTSLSKGEHGKPYLTEHPEVHFNLSHAAGIAACVTDEIPCGIDCEMVREYRPNVLKRAFSAEERTLIENTPEQKRDLMFFRLWTLKEAYVKALGTGIAYPLDKACFSFESSRIIPSVSGYSFRQYILKGGKYVVSVCRAEQ